VATNWGVITVMIPPQGGAGGEGRLLPGKCCSLHRSQIRHKISGQPRLSSSHMRVIQLSTIPHQQTTDHRIPAVESAEVPPRLATDWSHRSDFAADQRDL